MILSEGSKWNIARSKLRSEETSSLGTIPAAISGLASGLEGQIRVAYQDVQVLLHQRFSCFLKNFLLYMREVFITEFNSFSSNLVRENGFLRESLDVCYLLIRIKEWNTIDYSVAVCSRPATNPSQFVGGFFIRKTVLLCEDT